ncbi:MAG: short-chain dehydrogenase/reductase, partial [Dehalococcoidia bacterium]|nr:short-chain dehydrogenase/reductase [Dehalococcoidia bacterium]
VDSAVARALSEGGLDALVNNAGYGLSGAFEELTLEELRAVFETNYFSVLRLSKAVLPSMRERGHGTIVNVGSVAGLIGVPMEGGYSATKFALRSMSRSMRMELSPFGVRVVLIEPGVVRTDFHVNKVVAETSLHIDSPYAGLHIVTELRARARALFGGKADRTAMRICQVIESRGPAARYTVGIDAWAGAWASRLLPDAVVDFFMRRAIMGR